MHHPIPYRLTREQLRQDLREAYYDARRHKRQRPYQQRFEARLSENLEALCTELWTRTYRPRPSTCFIIRDPKVREIFAADFRCSMRINHGTRRFCQCQQRLKSRF